MTMILHTLLYTALALLAWVTLVLCIGAAVNGRAWVWARTREASLELLWRLRHGPRLLPATVRLRRDEPLTFIPGRWLR